jgi:conjugal transfer pilus assembly protein TraF
MGISFSAPARADNYWSEHAVGWHWYQDPLKDATSTPPQPQTTPQQSPIQTMEAIQKQVKYSLDQAILNPTSENVRNYITLQNQISQQANQFAQVWRATLLNYPTLDYSLQHPTNAIGKQVYLDQAQQVENQAIAKLAQHSGLIFFYRSTCPYCQRFAPIVKDFSQRYGISVLPVTTDGISLPEFPNSHIDQGQAAHLRVTMEPALFTVDPYSHQIVPVGFGLMGEDELRGRILTIANQGVQPNNLNN